MLICQRCSTQNKDGSKFCKECGGSNLYDPDAEIKRKKREEERIRQEKQRAEFIKYTKRLFALLSFTSVLAFGLPYAFDYLDKKGCMDGGDFQCVKVAEKYMAKNNYIEAKRYYEKSCELNNAESCKILLENGGYYDENYYLNKICEYGYYEPDICRE